MARKKYLLSKVILLFQHWANFKKIKCLIGVRELDTSIPYPGVLIYLVDPLHGGNIRVRIVSLRHNYAHHLVAGRICGNTGQTTSSIMVSGTPWWNPIAFYPLKLYRGRIQEEGGQVWECGLQSKNIHSWNLKTSTGLCLTHINDTILGLGEIFSSLHSWNLSRVQGVTGSTVKTWPINLEAASLSQRTATLCN